MNIESRLGDNIAASNVVGAVRKFDVEEVRYSVKNMKNGKSNRPFGVIEMLKAGGEPCSHVQLYLV